MLDNLMTWVAKWAVGKKVVGTIALVHDKLDGKRSEIIVVLMVVIEALKVFQIIPAELATTILTALTTLLPLTLADKASKVMKQVDDFIPH
jgi:hypothetical protein